MKLELFINFDGNCREAVQFYAKVFQSEVQNLMTYSEVPPDENQPIAEADKDRIMYAGMQLGDMMVMFMDMPTGMPLSIGDNITPTINVEDKDEVTRLFDGLKEGGEVFMAPQKTFYSDLYAMVKDKFGVIWHILYYVPQQ